MKIVSIRNTHALLRPLALTGLMAGGLAGPLWTAGCGDNSSTGTMMMTSPDMAGSDGGGQGSYTPPTPPQVQKLAGMAMATPRIVPVYFTGDKVQAQLQTFVQSYVTKSMSWQVLKEYGVGAGTAAAPTVLGQTLPGTMTDADVQKFIAARIADGSVVADAQSVVMMFPPQTTAVSNGSGVGCYNFSGYHNFVKLPSGSSVAYAVVPHCAATEPLSYLTSAVSHELAEAVTDPTLTAYNNLNDPYALWALNLSGYEIGDLCTNLSDYDYTEAGIGVVSRLWSNAAMAAFTNPCLPGNPAPNFFSIPTIPQQQQINVGGSLRNIEQIPIAAGQQTTISVHLLSSSRPSPTWSVTPLEVPFPSASGTRNPKALTFAWVEAPRLQTASGQDGQTLHLQITAVTGAPVGLYTSVRLISVGPTTAGGTTETDWVAAVVVTN